MHFFREWKDSFSCFTCQRRGEGMDEFKCNGCGSYVCEHLVLIDGGMVICFCCHKDRDRKWPDWSYTMIEDREAMD